MTDPTNTPTPPGSWAGQAGSDARSAEWASAGPGTEPAVSPPPRRTPLPTPAGSPRALRVELAMVLVLAFAPGLLGLLVLALGAGGSTDVEAQLVPAIVSSLFELVLSWTPVLVIAYLLARSREGWAGIGLTRFRPGDLGMGAVLWVAGFVLVLVLAQLFQYFGTREVDFVSEGLPLWFRTLQAIGIAATAGFTEEVVVRGYAQTRLEQLRASTAVILLLPTALWGALHVYQGLGAAMTVFCLGLMYAWYFNRTRRLWPLILAHALFNMTQLVFILAGA